MPASHLQLRRLYNFYNRKFFNSELPADTVLLWSPCDDANGITQWIDGRAHVKIDPAIQAAPKLAHITLIHEMIHVKNPRCGHGRVFKAERQRLWDLGAFDKLI